MPYKLSNRQIIKELKEASASLTMIKQDKNILESIILII
jgi:hypothetical protein